MKQLLLYIVLLGILVSMHNCSKKSDPPEANLVIAVNPDPGTAIMPALSANYPFKLLINSTPPQNGVKIDIAGTRDDDNSVQFTQSSQTTGSNVNSVDLQLTGLVPGVLYNVKVNVTSLTTAANKASITFKVTRK